MRGDWKRQEVIIRHLITYTMSFMQGNDPEWRDDVEVAVAGFSEEDYKAVVDTLEDLARDLIATKGTRSGNKQ